MTHNCRTNPHPNCPDCDDAPPEPKEPRTCGDCGNVEVAETEDYCAPCKAKREADEKTVDNLPSLR